MAFRVYPDPQVRPLEVAGGATSALVAFDELVGVDPETGLSAMFLRMVKLGGMCAPSGPPHPTLRLRAGEGEAVDVPTFPTTAPVFTGPGGTGDHAGDATLVAEDADVYRMVVFIDRPGSRWQIQIANPDAADHGFTWVVADADAHTRQPWIDVAAELAFAAVVGQPLTRRLLVANLGTGPLTIADRAGTALGEGFVLTTVPGPIPPNACADVEISFSTSTPGTARSVYAATSNDTTAATAAGHNRRVELSAAAHRLPPGTIVLAARRESGASVLLRVDPATGVAQEIAGGDSFPRPVAVAVESDGTILVADGGATFDFGTVTRLDPITGERTTVAAFPEFTRLADMVLGAGGDILVLHRSRHDIGGITRVERTTGAQTRLLEQLGMFPIAMAAAENGTLVVLHNDFDARGLLLRVRPEGTTATVTPIPSEPPFSSPQSLTVLADGAIVVANQFRTAGGGFTVSLGQLLEVDPTTASQTTLLSTDGFEPLSIVRGSRGTVFVGDGFTHGVLSVDLAGGNKRSLFTDVGLLAPFLLAIAGPNE